jgi:hypothetical protein
MTEPTELAAAEFVFGRVSWTARVIWHGRRIRALLVAVFT